MYTHVYTYTIYVHSHARMYDLNNYYTSVDM